MGASAIIGGIGAAAAVAGTAASIAKGSSSGGYDKAAAISRAGMEKSLAYQRAAYEKNLELQYPWLRMGKEALGRYGMLLGMPVSSYDYPSSFSLMGNAPMYPTGTNALTAGTTGTTTTGTPSTATGGSIWPSTGTVGSATDIIRATPGYQFEESQGLNALGRYAAARGLDYSGAQMRGVTGYGQSLADKYYNQYMNQLAGLYGAGQTGAGQAGGAGVASANTMGQIQMGGTNALAQAAIGASNAQSASSQNMFNNLTGLGMMASRYGGNIYGNFGADIVDPYTGVWG